MERRRASSTESEASDGIEFLLPGAAINLAHGVFALALAARNNLGDRLKGGHGASWDLVRMGFAVELEPVRQVLDLALPRDLARNLCHGICHMRPIELAVDLGGVRPLLPLSGAELCSLRRCGADADQVAPIVVEEAEPDVGHVRHIDSVFESRVLPSLCPRAVELIRGPEGRGVSESRRQRGVAMPDAAARSSRHACLQAHTQASAPVCMHSARMRVGMYHSAFLPQAVWKTLTSFSFMSTSRGGRGSNPMLSMSTCVRFSPSTS